MTFDQAKIEYEKYKIAEHNYFIDKKSSDKNGRLIQRVILAPSALNTIPESEMSKLLFSKTRMYYDNDQEYDVFFFFAYSYPGSYLRLADFIADFELLPKKDEL